MSINTMVARLGRGVSSEKLYETCQKMGFQYMRNTSDGTTFFLGEARVLRITPSETQILSFKEYKAKYTETSEVNRLASPS